MWGKFLNLYIFAIAFAIVPVIASAKPKRPAPPPVPPVEDSVTSDYLEETRKSVSTRVLRLADKIDSLFGDKRSDDKKNTSTLRVSQRYFSKDGEVGAEDISATLNLYLPNLRKIEDRIKEKFKSKETTEEAPEDELAQPEEENPWDLNQESGVVIAVPVNYFARLRLRRDFLIGNYVHSFYEQIGWSKSNEWEEQTSLTSDFAINRTLLFRFVNTKDWAITNNTFGTTHGPSLLHEISEKSAISYDLRFNTALESNGFIGDRVSVSSLYRTQLPLGWMYLELTPEIAWERKTNFRPLHNFYVRFEIVFGNLKQ